jgi:hypothetical protein
MSNHYVALADVPAHARCPGSGQPVPPQSLPQGPRLRAGRCPVCGRLYGRHRRTGAIYPHPPPDQQAAAPWRPDRESGADAPVPVVASEEAGEPEDPKEPDEPATVPTGIIPCVECTILIGPGYLEPQPFPHPHGQRVVCGARLASLERRARRGPTPLGSAAQRVR